MGVLSRLFGIENQEQKQDANRENPNVAKARCLVNKGESLQKEIRSLEKQLLILHYGLNKPSNVELTIIHPEIDTVSAFGPYGSRSYPTEKPYRFDMPDDRIRQLIVEMIHETEHKLKHAKYQYENL